MIDAYRYKREANGIDQRIDQCSIGIIGGSYFQTHLCEILQGKDEQSHYDEMAGMLIAQVLPLGMKRPQKQVSCIDDHEQEAAKLEKI